MTDVFAFFHKGGNASAGSCYDKKRGVFAVSDEDGDSCAPKWTAACADCADASPEDLLRRLLQQAGGQSSFAALAIGGGKAVWTSRGGAKVCRFHGGEMTLTNGSAEAAAGDAFLLCSDSARRLLLAEEIRIDLLKAENARRWAELLLLRIMERLDKPPAGLGLLTVRVS